MRNFFNLSSYLTKKSWWTDIVFYFSFALLIASVFCYVIFTFKIYLQNQKIISTDESIAVYGTAEQKAYEKKIFEYKKTIDDFASVINKHKISSNILSFIEGNTLPNVWFSNFDMSESTNEIRLLGEAEDMVVLSHQIQIFEQDKDYISNITVLSSQIGSLGKIGFIINLSLGPKIFTYQGNAMPIN